jgi:hypothetical protein
MDDSDKTPDIVQATLIGVRLQYLGTTERYEYLTHEHQVVVVRKANSLIEGLKIVDSELQAKRSEQEF